MAEALPANPLGQKLCSIFSYRWSWLEAPIDGSVSCKWKTNTKYPIKARSLWSRFQDAAQLIGVRFGSSTLYGMIDVDRDSRYIDQIDDIKAALEPIGICRTIAVQSSWSGGIHLYVPLAKAYPTFSVALVIKSALEAQGFILEPGHLEVFPNCKAYADLRAGEKPIEYNGHRLPLQPASGSRLLDDQLQPLICESQLARFFALWSNAATLQDDPTFRESLAIARANRRNRARKAAGPVESWRDDLERIIAEGWTGQGQTNDLLRHIATYGRVFERLSGSALTEYVERIATSRPGYAEFCGHKHEIWRRCQIWARSVESFYWPLGSAPLRDRDRSLEALNQIKADEARERILEAVRELGNLAGQPIRSLAQRLCKLAHTSMRTLYKYRHLWEPDKKTVTPLREPITADSSAAPIENDTEPETLATEPVTVLPSLNEGLNLKSSPLKNLSQGEREGVEGERKGLSTDDCPPLPAAEPWEWPL